MNRYARIQDGVVAELFATADDITTLFNPALVWVPWPEGITIAEGWLYENGTFTPPAPVSSPPEPSLAELQAQLQALEARVSALLQHS